MATTIQQIELPKKARALDTSSGWQTVGSNLITNGAFASDTAWSKSNSTISGSKGVLDGTSVFSMLWQNILTNGETYRVTFDVEEHNGDITASQVVNNAGQELYAITGNGTGLTFDFTHVKDSGNLLFRAKTGSTFKIDNVSVLKLENFSNNNHGQIYSGRGLEFDGVSDYLTADSIAPFVHSDFTSSFWINPTLDGYTYGPGGRVIWSAHSSANANILLIVINGTSNSIRTYSNSAHDISSTTTALLQGWQRVVIMKSGTSFTVYVNGILNGTSTIADNITSGAGKFSIGQEYDGSGPSDFYLGMMSDFQVWDTLWSAADVTYDYLNPESLALNNSGTALTESNLKLWYPMQDGHRGQQSYILDGANTGAVVELVTNGDFANGETDWTFSSQCEVVNDQARILSTDGSFQYISQNNVFDTSKNYKLEFDVISSNGATLGFAGGISDVQTTTLGRKTIYTSPSTTYLQIKRSSGVTDVVIDNVSVKAINDKHHATTVFYGDELVTNGTFTGVANGTDVITLSGWSAYNSPTSRDIESEKLEIIATGANQGAILSITTTVGRTYKLQYTATGDTGASGIYINNVSGVNTSTETTYSFVAVAATTTIYFRAGVNWIGTTYYDDISVKEVGVASGWTDADQQLHIPQTALQSYNELAWFDGHNDFVNISDDNSLDVTSITISAWLNTAVLGLEKAAVAKSYATTFEFGINSDGQPHVNCKINGVYNSHMHNTGTALAVNTWNHVVWTYDRSSNSSKTYLNGVLNETVTPNAGDGAGLGINADSLLIGGRSASALKWNGSITEVGIWSSAITSDEVQAVFNDGKALDVSSDSGSYASSGDLVSYWRNNGLSSWTDLKGSNNGTPTNITETILIPQGVDSTRDAQGFIMNKQKSTSCLNFPTRSGDYAEVLDHGDLDFGTGDFSYECWAQYGFINNSDIGGAASGLNVILSNGHASSSNTRGFNLLTNSSKFLARIGDGAKEDSLNIQNRDDDGDAVAYVVGDWYHIAVTRTGTTLRSYVDGAPSDYMTNMESDISVSTDTPFRISDDTVDSRDYKWPVDSVRLYSKELSAAEVLRNYNATKGNHRN
jgi:hypothetical protein